MNRRAINPTKTGWAHGHEISNASRIVFISGIYSEVWLLEIEVIAAA